jgi:hypothetical protein
MTDTASTDLEVFQHGDLDPATSRILAAQWRESQRLAMTAVVPKTITHKRQNVNGSWQDVAQDPAVVRATVFAVVRYGSFFGFEPAISLGKIDVIEGRLEARYDALAGLMMDAGHQVRLREVTAEVATIGVRRREDRDDPNGWQVVSFTAEEARTAGYIKANPEQRDLKGAWYTRRPDMLMSKAIKRACRWITPDVLVQREYAELVEGATVEQVTAPVAELMPEVTSPSARVEEPFPGGAEEPVDAEIIEPAERDADDEPSSNDGGVDTERRAKAQRQLMATATKAFPKDPNLAPADQRAKVTAQRHAVAYVALSEHKSANDMTAEELVRVTARLDDVIQGRLAVEERDGQWVAIQGDTEVVIPPEHEQ